MDRRRLPQIVLVFAMAASLAFLILVTDENVDVAIPESTANAGEVRTLVVVEESGELASPRTWRLRVVRVWDLDALLKLADERIIRDFTADERNRLAELLDKLAADSWCAANSHRIPRNPLSRQLPACTWFFATAATRTLDHDGRVP